MTDQTTADLIATAKAMRDQLGEQKPWSILALWFETAERLEAAELERNNWRLSAEEAERAEQRAEKRAEEAERQTRAAEAEAEHLHVEDTREIVALTQERDALAAVVEQARLYCENQGDKFRYHAGRILDILAASPADALREKARQRREEQNREG